ncbi:MAG: hypothetical protein D6731_22700 [Planctomycetota bacterium]|nr:MAG: hypothetical protein D6731_22700 [Planctomycetota bacterium]
MKGRAPGAEGGGPFGRAERAGAGDAPAWARARPRGGRLGNLFFAALAGRRLGLVLVPFFLFWVSLYFVCFAPRARRASFELARRLGLRWRLLFCWRHFYAFGRSLIDRQAILAGNTSGFCFASRGKEHLEAALAEGRGAILLTAHFGNWELMAHVLGERTARVTLVMHEGVAEGVRSTLERLAQGRSFRVIFTDGSPSAAAGILSALAEGDIVGLMGDRVLAGAATRVPLLGAEVRLPVGPYVLAAASGAPLLHAFCTREGRRRYVFEAFPAQTLRLRSRRRRKEDLRRLAAAFAQRLEDCLRRRPEQWGNLYSLWEEAERCA